MQNIIIPKLVDAKWVDTWMAIAALAEIEVAALNDDAEFFRKDRFTHRYIFPEAVYIVAALAGGAQVAEWAGQWQIENVLTEMGGLELRYCMISRVRYSWPSIWSKVMKKIIKIPLLRRYAIYHAAALGAKTLAALHSVKKITRKECMLWNGLILRKTNDAAKKYLIKTCGLSQSDLASMGVLWPEK